MNEFTLELKTLRQRGPRVHIRIRFLLEYLTFFNRPKIYMKRDEATRRAQAKGRAHAEKA
jgi:hypothetical protein